MQIEVKDFGPISEGSVELKPLTVFVGPNGSGKSYMAMLMYTLLHNRPFGGIFDVPYGFRMGQRSRYYRSFPWRYDESGGSFADFQEWLSNSLDSLQYASEMTVSNLPEKFTEQLELDAGLWIDRLIDSSETELPRCFGSELSRLSRSVSNSGKFSVALSHRNPDWRISISPNENKITSDRSGPSFGNEIIELDRNHLGLLRELEQQRLGNDAFEESEIQSIIAGDIFFQLFRNLFQQLPGSGYYLPAARSGILQSHKLLASAIVRRAPFAGIEPLLPAARLTGAVADFISGLLTMDSDEDGELFEVSEFLESAIAKGRIYSEATSVEYPEIYYETLEQRFLLHQTSSMVSEIAPLVLYLKHIVEPGDLLIIEEPESHLHPANQRNLAWGIVKMIRSGLKVMLTTHSDYFLTQLSNFIRLSSLEDERTKRGYDENDYLNPDDVGCYLFRWNDIESGSAIIPLEVSANDGIVEEEFYGVDEALYDEYIDLEGAIAKQANDSNGSLKQ